MSKNTDIIVFSGDLGFGGFNQIMLDFPDRFFNYGVAEFGMVMAACGVALSGKIPIVYSIPPFLLYRPWEALRTYVNHEKIPIKLVSSGRNKDYLREGISHFGHDVKSHLDLLPNIQQFWPENEKELVDVFNDFLYNEEPAFVSLKK